MEPPLLLTAGIILAGGALGGALARLLRLPSLTGYLAAGILLGDQVLGRLPAAHVELLRGPVNDLAMALALFVLGGQFRPQRLSAPGRGILIVSVVQAAFTLLCVSALIWPALDSFACAILLGIVALEVAPVTTLLVLEEYGARGPTTASLQLLAALSNVWAVFFFEVAVLILVAVRSGTATSPADVAWDVAGSLCFGLLAGHALILIQKRIGHGNLSLPLITVLLLAIGVCKLTGVPHMLAFLVTGAVVANRSHYFEPITSALSLVTPPVYVAFFVLSGMHLDLHVVWANLGVIGIYVLARTIGKVVGARLGLLAAGVARAGGAPPLGLGLLCQAGAALALAQLAASYDPVLGGRLLNIILGAVLVFELAGPVLLRHVVVAAGEVSLGQLLVRGTEARDGRGLLRALLRTLRHGRGRAELAGLTAGQIMRTGIPPLPEQAGLDDILRHANRVPLNHFPVVDAAGRLSGMVGLSELHDLAYDPAAASLVIAGDLTSFGPDECAIATGATLEEAAAAFARFPGNHLAVVDAPSTARFLGVVDRAEVLRLVARARRGQLDG